MGDSKDRGWEFLTSKNFDGNDEDGSWGTNNDDGSGSFYGADGSWGTKNSDGSASYYGSDGSWGTINADGSGSYYGADGSWGTKNSDGSSSFYGADGSSEYKGADEDNDDNSYSSDSDGGGSLLGAAIGLGILGVAAAVAGRKSRSSSSSYEEDSDVSYEREYQRQEELKRYAVEQRRQEKVRIKKEKKKAFRKKHWKGILISILLIVIALFGGYKYWEYSKLVPVGVSSDSLLNKDYESVIAILDDSGFTNVHTTPLFDLDFDHKDDDRLLVEVIISDDKSFGPEDKYPYDAQIVVKYHSIALGTVPLSAKEAKGEHYQDIVKQFKDVGFGNIVIGVDYDLITGWIKSVGEIESISIDGNACFEKNSQFTVDSEIEIVYHDFKRNNPNK